MRCEMCKEGAHATTHLLHVFLKPQIDSAACAVLHCCNVHAAQSEARGLLLLRAATTARCERLKLFAAALNLQQPQRLLDEGVGAATKEVSKQSATVVDERTHEGMQALLPEEDAAGRHERDIFEQKQQIEVPVTSLLTTVPVP